MAIRVRSTVCVTTSGGPTHIEMFVGTAEQYSQFVNAPRPDFK
jgi:hypothetical protein